MVVFFLQICYLSVDWFLFCQLSNFYPSVRSLWFVLVRWRETTAASVFFSNVPLCRFFSFGRFFVYTRFGCPFSFPLHFDNQLGQERWRRKRGGRARAPRRAGGGDRSASSSGCWGRSGRELVNGGEDASSSAAERAASSTVAPRAAPCWFFQVCAHVPFVRCVLCSVDFRFSYMPWMGWSAVQMSFDFRFHVCHGLVGQQYRCPSWICTVKLAGALPFLLLSLYLFVTVKLVWNLYQSDRYGRMGGEGIKGGVMYKFSYPHYELVVDVKFACYPVRDGCLYKFSM